MRLVDASAAIKWFVDEEFSDLAGALLESEYDRYAPRLPASEVGNAFWRKVRIGQFNHEEALEIAVAISRIPVSWADELADELSVRPAAVQLSLELEHPIYD